jgi:excisionase family DNA binding protein
VKAGAKGKTPVTCGRRARDDRGFLVWALQVSNLRPLPCETEPGASHGFAPGSPGSQASETPEDPERGALHTMRPVPLVRMAFSTRLLPDARSPASATLGVVMEPLMTVRELATMLRLSTATVYAMCRRGQLEHIRVGNCIRFPLRAVNRARRETPR